MRRLTTWLFGYHKVTVTGAAPERCLNRLNLQKIPFWNLRFADDFTITFCVYTKDLKWVENCAIRTMCQMESSFERGAPREFRGLRRRIYLLSVLCLSIITAIVIPRFVWFYEVEGNRQVPSEKILRVAKESGVTVGTYGKSIDPKAVKQKVLSKIPELSWLTVTQSGGKAKIVVRERNSPEAVRDRRTPQNVIASKPGMITQMSVLDGEPVVSPGQVVDRGELLISGYMDLEYKYRVCGAMGEVYAKTWYDKQTVTPVNAQDKNYTGKETTIRYLCIGRKRIKLSLDSGILPVGCDKMTKETFLTFPGGFTLPISVVEETYRFYETEEITVSRVWAQTMLETAVQDEVKAQMIAGEILLSKGNFIPEKGLYVLYSQLECQEMIGRVVETEIFKGDT